MNALHTQWRTWPLLHTQWQTWNLWCTFAHLSSIETCLIEIYLHTSRERQTWCFTIKTQSWRNKTVLQVLQGKYHGNESHSLLYSEVCWSYSHAMHYTYSQIVTSILRKKTKETESWQSKTRLWRFAVHYLFSQLAYLWGKYKKITVT